MAKAKSGFASLPKDCDLYLVKVCGSPPNRKPRADMIRGVGISRLAEKQNSGIESILPFGSNEKMSARFEKGVRRRRSFSSEECFSPLQGY